MNNRPSTKGIDLEEEIFMSEQRYAQLLLDHRKLAKEHQAIQVRLESLDQMLIGFAKYGYDYRDTTQFPEKDFDSNCLNNFLQKLNGSHGYSYEQITELKEMHLGPKPNNKSCECDFCQIYDKYRWATIDECGCACHSGHGIVGHESMCCEFPNGKRINIPYTDLKPAIEYQNELPPEE